MKKLAVLTAAVAALITANCQAYENLPAGYIVNNGDPESIIVSQKLYCYIDVNKNKEQNTHAVDVYDADKASEYIGEKFSTAYFNEQWNKLSAIQKSGKKITKDDSPLLHTEKLQEGDYTNLIVQKGLLNPEEKPDLKVAYSADKINDRNVINLTLYMGYANSAIAVRTSLLSANDMLYVLGSSYVQLPDPEKIFKDVKYDKKSEADKAESKDVKTPDIPTIGQMKRLMQLDFLDEDEVSGKIVKKAYNEHKKFIKAFKTVQPQAAAEPFGYTDNVRGKQVVLPEDWLYQQHKASLDRDSSGRLNFTVAVPMESFRKMAHNKNLLNYFNTFFEGYDDNATMIDILKDPGGEERIKNMYKYALNDFDQMMFTMSIGGQGEGKLLKLDNPILEEMSIKAMLDNTLTKVKAYKSDIFKLNDYSYDVRLNQHRGYLDLNGNITLFNQYHLDNTLRGAMYDAGQDFWLTMAWYTHKQGGAYDGTVAKQVEEWQF